MIGTAVGVMAGAQLLLPATRRRGIDERVTYRLLVLLAGQQVPLDTTLLFSSAWLPALLFHWARPPEFGPACDAVS